MSNSRALNAKHPVQPCRVVGDSSRIDKEQSSCLHLTSVPSHLSNFSLVLSFCIGGHLRHVIRQSQFPQVPLNLRATRRRS
mmetsp:Transcript_29800/g.67416  ORF Transcript_29800/g.67416 Transcript_29800/m.67416 type:complete len:81 (+) Transcript_29800:97-339(+)